MALTPRQKQVLDFLVDFTQQNGYSPSFEEIASGLHLASLATVHKHVTALQRKGYLHRNYNHSRSIEVSREYMDSEARRLNQWPSNLGRTGRPQANCFQASGRVALLGGMPHECGSLHQP